MVFIPEQFRLDEAIFKFIYNRCRCIAYITKTHLHQCFGRIQHRLVRQAIGFAEITSVQF